MAKSETVSDVKLNASGVVLSASVVTLKDHVNAPILTCIEVVSKKLADEVRYKITVSPLLTTPVVANVDHVLVVNSPPVTVIGV
ncbi:MAG: hypothetical protein Q8O99_06855 [bacterium]|nr:hypothetical protein [bacterium]